MKDSMAWDEWREALERARIEQTHWATPINSPLYTRHGRRGYWDRWGVFRSIEVPS